MNAAKVAPDEKALRTMGYKFAHGVMFVRHRSRAVADQEWEEMLADLGPRLERAQPLPVLVKTDDAGPNALQRNQLNQLAQAKGVTLRVAVMSDSRLIRGMVTAFSWMGSMQIRSIEPNDFAGALTFLRTSQITPGEAARLIAEIETNVG